MQFGPETSKPLNELLDVLLCDLRALSQGERELIATQVSATDDCAYRHSVYGAIAARRLGGGEHLVECIKTDFEKAEISENLRARFHSVAKM